MSTPWTVPPLLLALLAAAPSAAQQTRYAHPSGDTAASEALVLSGGGPRGMAHVGVLLRMQELGYDPDLVVGTSMGAVVGALYAAGYDAAEIRDRTLGVDWSAMFDPTPVIVGPERSIRLPMLRFDLDVEQLRVRRGLFGQWRINRALARLLFDADARSRGDFDRLARRFRAVATDLETGEPVVLDRGDLARAVAASMAFPGFFSPVRIDDRVLVDGGVVANLATSAARDLGATRVIAVQVNRPGGEISSTAPLAVIQRALRIMQERQQRDPISPDVLVAPEMDARFFGPAFPDDPAPLVEQGMDVARAALPTPAPRAGRGERALPPVPDSLAGLRIEAPDSALAALAHRVFRDVAPGPYDADAVLLAVDRLYATGLVQGVWPRIAAPANDPAAAPTLVVRLEAPPVVALSAAAGFDNDRGGRAWASLDRYATFARRPAIFGAAASVGGVERWGSVSARVHSLGRRSFAWSFGGHLLERDVRAFEDDVRIAKQVLRAGGWAGAELPHILRDRVLSLALRVEWIDVEDGSDGYAVGPRVRLAAVEEPARPVGIPLIFEAEHRLGSLGYSHVTLAGSREIRWSQLRAALLLDLRAVSPDAPADLRPALGDQHAVPGLPWGDRRGRARAVAGLDLAYPIRDALLTLRFRAGSAPAETPDLDAFLDTDAAHAAAGVEIGGHWSSPIGLVEVGWGVATVGDGRFHVSVGRPF